MRILLAASCSALISMASAGSASTQEIPVGARVRVTVPRSGLLRDEGTVTALSPDTLFLETSAGRARAVPMDGVTELDVAAGRRRHLWQGAAIGLAAGVAIGISDDILGGLLVCRLSIDDVCLIDPMPAGLPERDVGDWSLAGLGLGALAGWLVRTEHWTTVISRPRTDAAARAAIDAGPGRLDARLEYSHSGRPAGNHVIGVSAGGPPPTLGEVAAASFLTSAMSFVAGAYAGYHFERWLHPCACEAPGVEGLVLGSFAGPALATPLLTHRANGGQGDLLVAYGAAAAVAAVGFGGFLFGLDSSVWGVFLFGTPVAQSLVALLVERGGR